MNFILTDEQLVEFKDHTLNFCLGMVDDVQADFIMLMTHDERVAMLEDCGFKIEYIPYGSTMN